MEVPPWATVDVGGNGAADRGALVADRTAAAGWRDELMEFLFKSSSPPLIASPPLPRAPVLPKRSVPASTVVPPL